MTRRKATPDAAPIPALPKAVPYPPDSIWRGWEDGKPTLYRGHLFERQGHRIARVLPTENRDDV